MIRRLVILVIVLAFVGGPSRALKLGVPAKYRGGPVEFGVGDLNAALARVARVSPSPQPSPARGEGARNAPVRGEGARNAPAEGLRLVIGCPGDRTTAAFAEAMKALPAKGESFAIARVGDEIAIVGRDAVGAMYGCLELAERLDMGGRAALDIRKPIVGSPAVEFRAVNPFICLPYKEDDRNWWFLQEDYWKGYLNQLARARINWIDLHGMYDINSTGFPNIYPYFIESDQFPDVGVEPAAARRNLAMLKKVMRMAKARGIRFAMMSYSAGWKGQGLRTPTHEANQENLTAYTREVVRKMIDSCPDLEMIGFRIGESGMKEDFYRESYIPAIEESGRQIPLYTRTWGAKKERILQLGGEFPGRFLIEIKYNGEQFGSPYIVAGGRMAGWRDYSYRDYYTPPTDYKIIYQLRANGTHRVFPWGNPELAARSSECSLLGGAIGACVEPIDAYYPKYDYVHKDGSANRWYKWRWERDWLWYQVWGRTAYDPSLAKRDDIWVRMFARRFGKAAARDLYEATTWASMIVPDAYTSYAFGPDHRNHAPELEWGGDVKAWSKGQPFDTANIQPTREFIDGLAAGKPSARTTPIQMAGYLAEEAATTRRYLQAACSKAGKRTAEFNDLVTELTALAFLGDYYSHKLTAGVLYGAMVAASDLSLEAEIRQELGGAKAAWEGLAWIGDQHYKPFVDRLRMHTEDYTWSAEGEKLAGDAKALDEAVAAIKASGKTGKAPDIYPRGDKTGPKIGRVRFKLVPDGEAKRLEVAAEVADPAGVAGVSLKTKLFPSERQWTLAPMEKRGGVYVGQAEVTYEGLMWCVEAMDTDGNGAIWPNWREETPYRVVVPWAAGK